MSRVNASITIILYMKVVLGLFKIQETITRSFRDNKYNPLLNYGKLVVPELSSTEQVYSFLFLLFEAAGSNVPFV